MRICIVGTGHVGLVTGAGLASVGHRVSLVDIDPARVRAINRGRTPFYEPGLEALLSRALRSRRVEATTDLRSAVSSSDITIIAVGTPLRNGAIDLSALLAASEEVGAALRQRDGYHVVAVKSTVVPGTTDTSVREVLERASGRRAGSWGLCVNPEFLREGSAVQDVLKPDRIVIGQWDRRSGRILGRMYASFDCPTLITTLRNAELIKYTSNALLATLISFSNEIAALCEAVPGTDVEAVMAGLHLDRRLSPTVNRIRTRPGILDYLRAGCGFGGSCLPKDVAALRRYADDHELSLPLLEAVLKVNRQRPTRLVGLAEHAVGSLKRKTVAVLGLAFKPGTDDLRESPALAIIRRLLQKRARVRAYDPCAARAARTVLDRRVKLCESPEGALERADAAIIVTAWPEFTRWDWKALIPRMRRPIIVDGRNGLHGVRFPAGTIYLGIGRRPQPA